MERICSGCYDTDTELIVSMYYALVLIQLGILPKIKQAGVLGEEPMGIGSQEEGEGDEREKGR